MAHKLADEKDPKANSPSSEKSTDSNDKGLLNRRRFVKGAAAVTATLLSTQAGLTAASDNGEAFRTDFSEYAQ